ncbi:spermatid perinuclear RNA-binding protein [Platysternon megacephalum]|uniref:Spermatid perinuclear RNA-binding protein n=1 Tax=Platysternon megacephalum TaxID=55544 RepID=A0A4D9ECL8_9SAUR|nr:spermatid perinuclear RNA-binding protein [Platysternon megacephalum]
MSSWSVSPLLSCVSYVASLSDLTVIGVEGLCILNTSDSLSLAIVMGAIEKILARNIQLRLSANPYWWFPVRPYTSLIVRTNAVKNKGMSSYHVIVSGGYLQNVPRGHEYVQNMLHNSCKQF